MKARIVSLISLLLVMLILLTACKTVSVEDITAGVWKSEIFTDEGGDDVYAYIIFRNDGTYQKTVYGASTAFPNDFIGGRYEIEDNRIIATEGENSVTYVYSGGKISLGDVKFTCD